MNPIEALMEALRVLPGVGRKTAQRLAYYLIRCPDVEVTAIQTAMARVREELSPCSVCGHLDDSDPCAICGDEERDRAVICVVEDSLNVMILERTGAYRGLYHVLGGVLSPLRGIGPESLRLEPLERRVRSGEIREVILATNPSVEGMVTSRYIEKMLKAHEINLTELARGLSIGTDLEFADEITLTLALEGRKPLS